MIDAAHPHTAAWYLWLLGNVGGARVESALLAVLRGPRRSLWMQAAASLSMIGTSRVVPALQQTVRHGDAWAGRREAAAYTLAWIDPKGQRDRVISTLLDVLGSDDAPRVRAQAAESVAQHLRLRKGRTRARAERVLIEHLADPSADVRFWCAYALGTIKAVDAVPALRELARDRTMVSGWWRVGTEARDALTFIVQGEWPVRVRRRQPT